MDYIAGEFAEDGRMTQGISRKKSLPAGSFPDPGLALDAAQRQGLGRTVDFSLGGMNEGKINNY